MFSINTWYTTFFLSFGIKAPDGFFLLSWVRLLEDIHIVCLDGPGWTREKVRNVSQLGKDAKPEQRSCLQRWIRSVECRWHRRPQGKIGDLPLSARQNLQETSNCPFGESGLVGVQEVTDTIRRRYTVFPLQQKNKHFQRSFLCVWSLQELSKPLKILVASNRLTSCCFGPNQGNLVFAGLSDG